MHCQTDGKNRSETVRPVFEPPRTAGHTICGTSSDPPPSHAVTRSIASAETASQIRQYCLKLIGTHRWNGFCSLCTTTLPAHMIEIKK